MSSDKLTELQIALNQLLVQYYSVYSYLSQRHPLAAPQEIPGQRFTSQTIAPTAPGEEDTASKAGFPLQPQDPKDFQEAQKELAEDLVVKIQQIRQLIVSLPGIDQNEDQQADAVKKLIGEVEEMEQARKQKRREMRQLVKRLDAVVGGMNRSIDYSQCSEQPNGG